ncbi:MAG TPA: ABC transporter permease [Gemmatimonadaceae bacterium]|jgi:predicted permease
MTDGRKRYPELPRSRDRIHRDINEEIEFDLEMRIAELTRTGLDPRAARETAMREFGDIEATRRYCNEVDERSDRAGKWSRRFEDLRHDCTIAFRSMRATPAFAAIVLLTLAIGLGANVAIYSIVRRVLIDRLPYRDAQSLVRIAVGSGTTAHNGFVTPIELRDLAALPSLDGVAAFGELGSTNFFGAEIPEPIAMSRVTPNFFAVLGTSPTRGRSFGDGDVAEGAPPAVMISYEFWQQHLSGDSAAVGHTIRLSSGPWTVIGVMPREFVSPQFNADLWLPMAMERRATLPNANRMRVFRGVARLRAGATMERANADVATLAARWHADGVNDAKVPTPHVLSLRDAMVGQVRPVLLAVMSAALLVLIITCTNIAGLFLARATARRREMAVRVALGAGRGRLIRQLLTETMLYGIGGGALGVLLALIVHPPLARVARSVLPNVGEFRIDFSLIALAIGVALICGAAVGVVPAFAATRVDLRDSLSDASRGASADGERVRVRQFLVASQIAVAILLMVGAGLLLRSFNGMVNTPLGYSTEQNVLVFMMVAPDATAADQNARNAFFGNVMDRVRALPGVTKVAMTSIGPWNGPNGASLRLSAGTPSDQAVHASYLTASEDYFTALGTKLVRGRSVAAADRFGGQPVVLLSESTARQLFGNEDPLGRIVFVDRGSPKPDPGHLVIGVVADYRPSAGSDTEPAIYASDWQENPSRAGQFIVRTTGDASRLIPSLRPLVHAANPTSPLMYPRTMNEILRDSLAPQQLSLALFAVFATLALTLAAMGIYGVMSYVVAARTREFGIRAALGAQRGALLSIVLRQGMRASAIGAAIGLALAFSGARVLSNLLVGVSPRDPVTFIVAPLVLISVTLTACAIPGWRATRVDPVEALRME